MRDESPPAGRASLIPHPSSLFALALVFLAPRVCLLFVRAPFYDELFTLWMARQPVTHVIANLLHDSGPPLYYFLARFDSITALRLLSLVFATVQFALVARRSLLAGALLAVYPPAVLLAVDARAYALCALFVTIGVLADDEYVSACAFVLAAYSHYYGVLFFPLLLFRRQLRGFAVAVALFIPGFLLALQQPAAATKWNREALFAPLTNLSFAGTYPYALFLGAPLLVAVIALVLLCASVWGSASADPVPAKAGTYTDPAAVLIPLALVLAFHLAGRPVYFPMRFEAVIAAPLVVWIAAAKPHRIVAGSLIALGVYSIVIGIVDHATRPIDSYRQAALALKQQAKPNETIVATGYLYLEAISALNQPVIAWPAEQAQHPGWRATAPADPRALPQQPFLWIVERYAPEIVVARGVKQIKPLFWNDRALIGTLSAPTANATFHH